MNVERLEHDRTRLALSGVDVGQIQMAYAELAGELADRTIALTLAEKRRLRERKGRFHFFKFVSRPAGPTRGTSCQGGDDLRLCFVGALSNDVLAVSVFRTTENQLRFGGRVWFRPPRNCRKSLPHIYKLALHGFASEHRMKRGRLSPKESPATRTPSSSNFCARKS